MITKSKLSVSIHDAEFSKDYQYMITAQFQSQKKQTDISALVRNPLFTTNTLIFDLPSPHTLQGFIIFVAHMLLPSEEPSKQNTRVLGECSLDLTPFALQPTETYNLPIRQQLKFVRSKEGKQVTVGRFIASIKMVKEDALPSHLQDLELKKIQHNDHFAELPSFDPKHYFNWRVRLDVRQAMNIPQTNELPGQIRVETGWTEYKDSLPEESRLFSTSILQGPHPEWNQTILITNPMHIGEPKGFIMVLMRDQHNIEDIYRLYIPVQSMGRFVPYNIKLVKQSSESPTPLQFYISLMLQMPLDNKDRLADVVFQDVTFQPAQGPFKQMNIAAVIGSENDPKLQFLTFDPKQDSIQRILQFDQAEQFHYILSPTMRVPPIKSGNYKAAAVITISQALLRRKINFYLVGRLGKGSYKVAGLSQNVQRDLVSLLLQMTKKKLFLSVRNTSNSKFGSCQLQIIPPIESQQLAQSRASQMKGQQTASERLMKQLNFNSNESMLRHVAQNNDIIARILKQLDDKSQSLKQAAAEISDLRGRVKLLQNQNAILRQQALREEDELVNLVQREVQNMSLRDLKEKIVKISQLYKVERVKNRQLDRTVKAMEPQISNTMQLNSIIISQKNHIQTLTQKMERMTKQHQRINVYKQTIKKQQKVITKLESVMKEGMEEVRNARKTRVELQQLKRRQVPNVGSRTISRGQQKEEIARLHGIIAQLQANAKGGSKGGDYGDNSSQYQLQFKLHQAETRIASLEQELQQNSRSFARELAMLRMKLAQKDAVMDGYKN